MKQALRYDNLVREIDVLHPRRIVEIGTCKGERAEMMIRAARQHTDDVFYCGFDLFEQPPDEELSGRTQPWDYDRVRERLVPLGARVALVRGDTRKTLREVELPPIDLVFLDGGHSDETVRSDFENVLPWLRPGGTIMLDDYWNYPEGGCNALVDGLDRDLFHVEILSPVDVFRKPYGELRTQMVKVKLNV